MTKSLALPGIGWLLLASVAIAESDTLIDSLDLALPELAVVKQAVDRGDNVAARKAFADHLRRRTDVLWHFDPAKPPNQIDQKELEIARDALQHRFTVMDIPWRFDGPIDWKFNPTTLPDSKTAVTHEWTWCLNRHACWPILAKAYLATGEVRYAQELAGEIADWCTKNPEPPRAVWPRAFSPWRPIEAGIRMGSPWPDTFFMLVRHPDVFPDDVMLAMVEAMRGHANYLRKFPTTGNWKTMESNGLFHVGVLFPEFKDAAEWRKLGLARQQEELKAQVYPDGPQIELTPGYHNLALSMFVNTLRLAVLNKVAVPDDYKEVLERMFAVNMWNMMPDRTTPDLNDSGREGAVDMLKDGLALFPEHADWKWIVTDGKEGTAPVRCSYFFPYAGWAIMRSGWDRDARCLIMEGGPFGYGHQHEDKLSFILYAYGSRLVAEAGIFPYFESPSRRYSIDAEGHNVLSVDGKQQHRKGRSRNTYVTKSPLDLNWRSTPEVDYVEGSYGRGKDETWGNDNVRGFVHTRRMLFAKPDYWILIDTVVPPDDREHVYETTFHLDASDAKIDAKTKRVTTTGVDRPTLAIVPLPAEGLDVRIVKDQTEPGLLGWIANDTMELQPVPTALFKRQAKGAVHTLYVLAPAPPKADSPVVRVEPADVAGAVCAASIVFGERSAYGRGTDKVYLTGDGRVVLQRGGKPLFSSRDSSESP